MYGNSSTGQHPADFQSMWLQKGLKGEDSGCGGHGTWLRAVPLTLPLVGPPTLFRCSLGWLPPLPRVRPRVCVLAPRAPLQVTTHWGFHAQRELHSPECWRPEVHPGGPGPRALQRLQGTVLPASLGFRWPQVVLGWWPHRCDLPVFRDPLLCIPLCICQTDTSVCLWDPLREPRMTASRDP